MIQPVSKRPVGGFLPLRMPPYPQATSSVIAHWVPDNQSVWLLHNARSALHALWEHARPLRVWLPAYICPAVASAVPTGIKTSYFPLDASLQPSVTFLASEIRAGDHVLAVDYFGRPIASEFQALVRDRPEIGWIEDRAHALQPACTTWANWVLYSPRKLLGVPDGGILVAQRGTLPALAPTPTPSLEFLLPCLERFEDVDEVDNAHWYATYRLVEDAMTIGSQSMSRLTLALLQASPLEDDAQARRRNYRILHESLGEQAFFPEADASFTPMGFPILAPSAGTLVKQLAVHRVFAARHWSSLPSDPRIFATEHAIAERLVTLPIDYRYGEADMHRVAALVREALAHLR